MLYCLCNEQTSSHSLLTVIETESKIISVVCNLSRRATKTKNYFSDNKLLKKR